MTGKTYDAVIVGARCAGASTAMLLARQGYRVLVVDRAVFPSDTLSTHLIHPPGLAALRRWGLLDRVVATGCPEITTYTFDLGPIVISGSPAGLGCQGSYAPRRTVLDKILVDAAVEAGAEVREKFTVEGLVTEGDAVTGIRGHGPDGTATTEYGRVVIGADGAHSMVARAVDARRYAEKPKLQVSYYTYWANLPMHGGFEAYIRGDRSFAAWPTNEDVTLVICGLPMREFEANRADIEGGYHDTLNRVPAFADRIAAATSTERLVGTAVENHFRVPYGPGWALVGDAGYLKDFVTAQGIQDAFQDAELCAQALDETFAGRSAFDDSMRGYQQARDERVMQIYEFTAEFASLEPPPPEMQRVLGKVAESQDTMDGFVRVNAGLTKPSDFFSDPRLMEPFST
ncbi:NAD(P)/FAD-dependent oxidoreductase [Streptomyces sp. H27-H1]|uniref:NAD(P)/FAD-dependent oxidoreductase n=1 Tax=Streptomyces sp. H27-H1 TaxID=2996461 RepID=UPI00226FC526|nr:NAD(P)/FAD-dependent oxidoreductase [Streptomyces sp. H27-H1]MCY0926176.1 NAD(P)/FAD-dependent oxidoreductase [Streptomyces sp. H27-H1]